MFANHWTVRVLLRLGTHVSRPFRGCRRGHLESFGPDIAAEAISGRGRLRRRVCAIWQRDLFILSGEAVVVPISVGILAAVVEDAVVLVFHLGKGDFFHQ